MSGHNLTAKSQCLCERQFEQLGVTGHVHDGRLSTSRHPAQDLPDPLEGEYYHVIPNVGLTALAPS